MARRWPVRGLDIDTPAAARIYDYLLGGKDNYAADRAAADAVLAVLPSARGMALANRRFAARAAAYCAGLGIDQFVDVGTGLPTSTPAAPSVAAAVHAVRPAALVVGVDNDPVVLAHDRALPGLGEVVAGDVRDPGELLAKLAKAGLDFGRPIAVVMAALLHFVTPEQDPAGIVAAFTSRLAGGSRVVMSHGCRDGGAADPAVIAALEKIYESASSPAVPRTEAEIAALFDGLTLADPGLVEVQRWRPDRPEAPTPGVRLLGGVGRVPGAWR